jgi:competence protein ComEC
MLLTAGRGAHPSILIAGLSAGFLFGVFLAAYIDWRLFLSLGWLLLAVVLVGLTFWKRVFYMLPVIILAGILFGLWRGGLVQQELSVYNNLIGHKVSLGGVVAEDADKNQRNQTLLRLKNVSIEGHEMAGQIWVAIDETSDIRRSDMISVTGKVSKGFGAFAAAIYSPTLNKVERPVPGDVALHVRDWFGDAVRKVVPAPQADLGLGFLLGQRRGLPPELMQALQIAGLTHVIVASGYNLTILVRFARRAFEKVSKYLAALSSGLMITGFIAITGLSPSMNRAGLVAGLSLLAWYYGRRFHPVALLLYVAAMTVLIQPSFVWGDLGWLLSFAAFAGVMIVAPLLQAYFFGDKKPGTIRQIMGETVTAQLVTMPIIILAFGQASLVSVMANMLILPLVPLAMLLTFLTGLSAVILPGLATLLALPTTWLLSYMISVADYLAGLPWAQVEVELSVWSVGLIYLAIAVLCLYLSRATGYRLRESSIVE